MVEVFISYMSEDRIFEESLVFNFICSVQFKFYNVHCTLPNSQICILFVSLFVILELPKENFREHRKQFLSPREYLYLSLGLAFTFPITSWP